MVNKLDEARDFLKTIGMPKQQQSDKAAYTLLTLANQTPNNTWNNAINSWIRTHDVLEFAKTYYDKIYAENSREAIRKYCMHQFREAALIEDNGKATNSPNYQYRLTDEALKLIQSYKTKTWEDSLSKFQSQHDILIEIYRNKKAMQMMPVLINGQALHFSTGKHNALQKAIIEQFAPRFAPNCECLYVGDTIKKDLIKNESRLKELGFEITLHDKMPDVVLYRKDKNWLYFIEAVTSVGPMNPQRIIDINEMTKHVTSGKIFVTAFPDFLTYKKFSTSLAWETEVWISDMPDHMIHLNGDKFLGPHTER